jgi:ribosomal protein S18 acetylase RimI-like enzyme
MATLENARSETLSGQHPLDSAVWSSLTGPHAQFAEGMSAARRYPADVALFTGLSPVAGDDIWGAALELAGPDQVLLLSGPPSLLDDLPAGWQIEMDLAGVQMVATDRFVSRLDAEAVRLGADDVEEMLDLVARTEPGPFLPHTYRLGTYLGFRREGALVAMAGERLHPPGWTEISAVCTDPQFRRQGLSTRLIAAVSNGIRARGETPFLHTAAANETAIRLYQSLGFSVRRPIRFFALRTPQTLQ